jgi:hypothetical protein
MSLLATFYRQRGWKLREDRTADRVYFTQRYSEVSKQYSKLATLILGDKKKFYIALCYAQHLLGTQLAL